MGVRHCGKTRYAITSSACAGNAAHRHRESLHSAEGAGRQCPPLQIEARGHLLRSQQRLARAGELELSCGRGAPYGVTHTHFAIVSGSALASKSPHAASRKSRLAVTSVWSSIIDSESICKGIG